MSAQGRVGLNKRRMQGAPAGPCQLPARRGPAIPAVQLPKNAKASDALGWAPTQQSMDLLG